MCVTGCKDKTEVTSEVTTEVKVGNLNNFKLDLVGKWKTKTVDGIDQSNFFQIYDFQAGGKLIKEIGAEAAMTGRNEGTWQVDGDKLTIKYEVGSGESVIKSSEELVITSLKGPILEWTQTLPIDDTETLEMVVILEKQN